MLTTMPASGAPIPAPMANAAPPDARAKAKTAPAILNATCRIGFLQGVAVNVPARTSCANARSVWRAGDALNSSSAASCLPGQLACPQPSPRECGQPGPTASCVAKTRCDVCRTSLSTLTPSRRRHRRNSARQAHRSQRFDRRLPRLSSFSACSHQIDFIGSIGHAPFEDVRAFLARKSRSAFPEVP